MLFSFVLAARQMCTRLLNFIRSLMFRFGLHSHMLCSGVRYLGSLH